MQFIRIFLNKDGQPKIFHQKYLKCIDFYDILSKKGKKLSQPPGVCTLPGVYTLKGACVFISLIYHSSPSFSHYSIISPWPPLYCKLSCQPYLSRYFNPLLTQLNTLKDTFNGWSREGEINVNPSVPQRRLICSVVSNKLSANITIKRD